MKNNEDGRGKAYFRQADERSPFTEEMSFVPKPKKRGAGQVKIGEGSITRRENTMYKGPKGRKYFLCMKNLKPFSVFGAE